MDRSSDNLGQTISNIQRDLEELKSNQGNGSGGGGGGGGEEYYAGNGIDIDQSNTISIDTSVVATQTDIANKQDKLTAGSHISISNNNTISATGIPTKTSDLTNDSNFSSMEIVSSLPSTGSEDTLYFVPSADLPSGYERQAYINIPFKSSKTAYLPLSNVWTTTSWKMEFDFEVTENYDYNAIFGRIDENDSTNEIWGNSSSIYRWRAFGYTGPTDNAMIDETITPNKRYTISHDNLGDSFVTITNGNITNSVSKLTDTSQSSWQFAFGHREAGGQLYGKIYGYRSWNANGIVDNLVPAKRTSDNALGFFNLADLTFRAMAGANANEVTGGTYNSDSYDSYIWNGSAFVKVGENVYATSQLINDSGFLTSVSWNDVQNKPTFATVATTGDYDDLINKPTIPTVNNATLTIQKNGTTVQTFTANQSTAATANITVPTKTSDIANDSGFATFSAEDICGDGKNIILLAPSNSPLASFRLDGETSQNGTPTPSASVAVQTVTGENTVKIYGKNLLADDLSGTASTTGASVVFSGSSITVNRTTGAIGYSVKTNTLQYAIANGQKLVFSMNYKSGTINTGGTYQWRFGVYGIKVDGTNERFGDLYLPYNTTTPSGSIVCTATSDYVGFALGCYLPNSTNTTTGDVAFDCQLELGSTATDYEPGQGQSYEVNLGKNLLSLGTTTFDANGVTVTVDADGTLTLDGTATSSYNQSNKIRVVNTPKIVLGETVTYSYHYISGSVDSEASTAVNLRSDTTSTGYQYQLNASSIRLNSANASTTFQTVDTGSTKRAGFVTYVQILFPSGRVFNNLKFKLQLEKGSSATSYAAYFDPIELCKIGDYQDYIYKSGDKWYMHKAVGKYQLDGTESWGTATDGYLIGANSQSPFYNILALGTPSYESLCSHFYFQPNGTTWTGDGKCGFNSSGTFWVMYAAPADKNAFLAWLGQTKPSVYFPLATPTDTEITNSTLVGQLNALLATARTYAGINNIFTITPNEQGTLKMCFKGGIASPTLMAGCSATTNGLPGLVPAPSAGDQEKYLRGDGTWQPAGSSSDIPDGSITTAKLADSAVTTIKISDSNVTTAKIADSNVTTAKLADGAVTAAKLDSAIDSYSETEVATPYKFIDGHTIYKKTIHVTSITAREATYQHSISNLDIPVKIEGMLRDTNYGWQPLTRVLPAAMTGWGCGLGDLNGTTFKLFIGTSYTLSALSAYVTIYYTKY